MFASFLRSDSPRVDGWLPHETLFSLASRHHRIACNTLSAATCNQLFGHSQQGAAHDFPARVGEFVRRTGETFGNEESIIWDHTLLPFYFRFRSSEETRNAITAISKGGIGGLKGKLGLLASRMGASHPLKACEQCMAQDHGSFGTAYWHVDHQLPAIWVCPTHRTPLRIALYKANGEGRFLWCLPDQTTTRAALPSDGFESTMTAANHLADLAVASFALARNFHFAPDVLRATYCRRLVELDCRGESGRLNIRNLSRLLDAVCEPLSRIDELRTLNVVGESNCDLYLRLLHDHRGSGHPTRHLVFVQALFGDWSRFYEAYAHAMEHSHSHSHRQEHPEPEMHETPTVREDRKLEQWEAVALGVASGLSITSVAKDVGIAVATAMTWAAKYGQVTPCKPKFFTPSARSQAIKMLRQGASKAETAAAANISVQTITLLLGREPGLRTSWKTACFENARHEARATWARTADQLRSATPKALRQLQPAKFAWLYRNDRAWLEDFSSNLARAPRNGGPTIRWDRRDLEFSRAIEVAALHIFEQQPYARVRLSLLCDKIPQLKARLSDLDMLPLTRAALTDLRLRRFRPASLAPRSPHQDSSPDALR